jgi:uncharacterized repeat protein (TIGR01451 family)
MNSVLRRFSVLLVGLILFLGSFPVFGASIARVDTRVSPTHPAPGEVYTVVATLYGTTGTPCYPTVTASVAGLTSSPAQYRPRVHSGQPAQLRFTFNLAGVASGTDLTPTISWSGCGSGSSSSVSGGSATPTVQTLPTPAVSIRKTLSGAAKSIVSPGDTVTYQLEYASTGTVTATDLVITDTLDSRLEFVSASGGGIHSAGQVTWNLGDLDPGDANTVEVTVRVADTATAGTIDNTAQISATGATSMPRDTVTITVDTQPNIQLAKTIDDDVTQAAVLEAGRVITYQIAYENLGGGDAANVVITDVLPAELIGTPVLGGGISSSYDSASRTATWTIGNVPKKAGGVVTLTTQIDPTLGTTDFENSAQATFTGGQSNIATAHITVDAEPYLLVLKSVQPTLVAPGDVLTYTIEYRNVGSLVAVQPNLTDSLPAGVTPVPGSFWGSYDAASRTLEWTLPDLAPGTQGHSISYQVTVDPSLPNTDLVNQVIMTADNLPGVLTATTSANVLVRQAPALVPFKKLAAGSTSVIRDGDRITYEIAVENNGDEGTDGGVTIIDTLPAGLDFVSASAGGTESALGVVTWNLPDIAANDKTGVLILEVEVDGSQLADGDFIANAISVTAQDRFGRQFRETSSHAVVQYNGPPRVTVTKSAVPPETTPVFPGDTIDYTITATLDSRQGVSDLQIIDALPPDLEFIKASDPGVTTVTDASGTRVTWPVAALNSGSRSVTLQARVRPGLSPGESITNLAGAIFAAGSGFANPGLTQHFVSDAAVSLSKTRPADQAEVVNGEEISYLIKYENTGKIPLTGIRLQDTLPAGVALVAASPAPSSNEPGPPATLKWDLPDLPAGKNSSVSVTVRVDGATAGDILSNQAQLTSNEAQPATASVTSTVREAPRLVLTKTVNATTAHPGDALEFTVHYENQGRGEARNVVLTDNFPSGLTFVSASDKATPVSGVLTWDLGNLAPGASNSKIIRATVPAGNYVPAVDITNRSEIASDTASTTASATVSVTALPAFTVAKTVDRAHASPGDSLHYTLTVDKTGGPATSVTLLDLLSPNTQYVPGSANLAPSAASDIANGLLVWELSDLPEGTQSAVITFSAEIDPVLANGTPLNNQAALGATEVNAVLSNVATTLVDSQPVLTVRKTASTAVLFSPTTASGDTADAITYTITVENTGNAVATGVTVTDTLPAGLLIDPTSTTANVSGQTAAWAIPSLTPGAPVSYTIAARVANDLPDGMLLRNTASAQSSMPGVGTAVSAPVVTTVRGQAVLELEKQVSSASVKAGGQLTYTLTYRNTGTATSGGIVIEDLIPPATRFVSASDGGVDSGGGHVTWTLPPLKAKQTGSVTLTLQVDSVVPNGTRLRNLATISETTSPQASVPATFAGKFPTVSSTPVLEIEKTARTGGTVTADGTAIFDIVYRNVGSDTATNVVISDTLPPGMSLVSASDTPAINGNTLTWTLPQMKAGTKGSLTVTAQADASLADGKVLTNSASVFSTEQPLPQADTTAVTVLNAVLTLTKSADRPTANSGISATNTPGDFIAYTLKYENRGGAAATDTVVSDTLPPDVTFVSATPAPDSVAGDIVSWNLGTVAANAAPGTVGLIVQVADDLRDGTVLHNTATIASATTGSTAAQPADTIVSSSPVLTISKTSAVSHVTPGQTVAYDITVENVGSDTARNVRITDRLPAEMSFVSATAGGIESGGIVTWDIEADRGPLAPNTSVTVHVEATADAVITSGTPLLNISSVTGEEAGGAAIPPVSSTLLLPVVSSPVLEIDFTADQATVQAGGALLYTLRVRNTGNAIAENVTVAASLPPDGTPQSITDGGTFANGSANWTIGSLPPSGAIELQFSVFIAGGVTDGTAEGSVGVILASNAPSASASVLAYVGAQAAFTLTKSGPNSVNAGDPLTWAIDYFNSGNGAGNDVVIEDTLPAGTVFVNANNGGAEVSPGIVRWDIGTLAPLSGGRVTVTVDTVVGVHDGTSIDNMASISSSNAVGQIAAATTIERSETILDVKLATAQDPVPAGGQQTFTVTWANLGNQDTTNAVVTATIPANSTFASATGSGGLNGNVVAWPAMALPAGASGSATFTVDIASPLPDGMVLSSTASITANEGLPDSYAAPFLVSSTPVWSASKTADATTVAPGAQVAFTIALQNLGNANATGVVVTDTLPAGLMPLAADNGGAIDTAANTVTWDLGDVPPAATPRLLTVSARVLASSVTLTNTAQIESNELPPLTVSASIGVGAMPPVPASSWSWLIMLMALMAALAAVELRRARSAQRM